MAVETFDLTIADVLARYLPNVKLDGSSKPTATQGGNILTEVAAEVNGALSSAGFTPASITSGDTPVSYQIVRKTIAIGTAGYIIQARQSSIGSNEYLSTYSSMLKSILATPDFLSDAFDPSSSAQTPRSHITDNSMTSTKEFQDDATPPWSMGDDW